MSPKSFRVLDLAREAGCDLDEALLSLWDAGITYVDSGSSLVAKRDSRSARHALGLPSHKDELTIEYWRERSGLDFERFLDVVQEVGIRLDVNTRRIPKGSLRRFRSLFPDEFEAPQIVQDLEPVHVLALPVFVWEKIGRDSVVHYLTEEEIELIHQTLEKDFAESGDPISPPGVKDRGLLSSAAFRPMTSLGGILKYETVELAGAALIHSIILNHPFFNGNKRTGLVSLIIFLNKNGMVPTCNEDELFRLTLRIAKHGLVPAHADEVADREVIEIARWIRSNTRLEDHQERPMKWHRLRRRLRELGCESEPSGNKGNRLNISRVVHEAGVLGIRRSKTLETQVGWSGDGTDAPRNTIHKIRKDLKLDDENGFDSAAFYDDALIDSFIAQYRGLLERLSKL